MSCLPKPVLRGHIKRRGLRGLIGSFCFAGINTSLYYFFVSSPRQARQEEFFKNYDPEAHYKDMVKWGYMTDPNTAQKIIFGK